MLHVARDARAPPMPGSRAIQAQLAALMERRDKLLFAPLRREGLMRDASIPVAELTRRIQQIAEQQAELNGATEAEIAEIARKIVASGIRSAAARSSVFKTDPRTWGASEMEQVQQALVTQQRLITKGLKEHGDNVVSDITRYLAQAQALGTEQAQISRDLQTRWQIAADAADNRALQTTRAGIEQSARARAQGAGVQRWRWRTVDRFARPSHLALEGTEYDLDKSPSIGYPGEEWGCRCWQEFIIPDDIKEDQPFNRPQLTATQKYDPKGLPLMPDWVPPELQAGGMSMEALLKRLVKVSP